MLLLLLLLLLLSFHLLLHLKLLLHLLLLLLLLRLLLEEVTTGKMLLAAIRCGIDGRRLDDSGRLKLLALLLLVLVVLDQHRVLSGLPPHL